MRLTPIAIFLCFMGISFPLMSAPLPKVIHTCNFDDIIDLTHRIENWRRVLPDYEIKKWDKSNFDLNENAFVKKAFKARQYDLLSAYCSYKVLYEQGGVYLSPFWQANQDLSKDAADGAFMSFMHDKMLSGAVMAMPKRHPLMGELVNYYRKDPRALGLVPPNYVLTDFVFKSYPTFQKNGKQQSFKDDLTLYPATRYILNLGSHDNIGNYRFDYTPKNYKTAEMSFGVLKELFLKEHAFKILYNEELYHVIPSGEHTFTIFEKRQHVPWGYVDEHTAGLNWLGPTLRFEEDHGVYIYRGNYVLANQNHYGNAIEIKVQGNDDTKGAKKK